MLYFSSSYIMGKEEEWCFHESCCYSCYGDRRRDVVIIQSSFLTEDDNMFKKKEMIITQNIIEDNLLTSPESFVFPIKT